MRRDRRIRYHGMQLTRRLLVLRETVDQNQMRSLKRSIRVLASSKDENKQG